MKTCTGCNKTKDETEFYGHDKPGHGHAKCKACVKASRKTPEAVAKRRKERSKPEFVARVKAKRQDPDGILKRRAQRAAWMASHPGYLKDYLRKNRDEQLEKRARHRHAHPEKRRVWDQRYQEKVGKGINAVYARVRSGRKRALDADFDSLMDECLRDAFGNRCLVTGESNTEHVARTNKRLTIDHIEPLSKGNKLTFDNACLVTLSVNSRKGARGRGYYTEAQQAEIVSCQRTAKLLYAERKPQREALCA